MMHNISIMHYIQTNYFSIIHDISKMHYIVHDITIMHHLMHNISIVNYVNA